MRVDDTEFIRKGFVVVDEENDDVPHVPHTVRSTAAADDTFFPPVNRLPFDSSLTVC